MPASAWDTQEVSPDIRDIFESFAWWKEYHSAPVHLGDPLLLLSLSKLPLSNVDCRSFAVSSSGRIYLVANINPSPTMETPPIRIATVGSGV